MNQLLPELIKLIFAEPQILIRGHQLNRYFRNLLSEGQENLKFILLPTVYEKNKFIVMIFINVPLKSVIRYYYKNIFYEIDYLNNYSQGYSKKYDSLKQIINTHDFSIHKQFEIFMNRGLNREQSLNLINKLLDDKDYNLEDMFYHLEINSWCRGQDRLINISVENVVEHRKMINGYYKEINKCFRF